MTSGRGHDGTHQATPPCIGRPSTRICALFVLSWALPVPYRRLSEGSQGYATSTGTESHCTLPLGSISSSVVPVS